MSLVMVSVYIDTFGPTCRKMHEDELDDYKERLRQKWGSKLHNFDVYTEDQWRARLKRAQNYHDLTDDWSK